MTEEEIEKHQYVSSHQTTKWEKYFTEYHREAFADRFDEVLVFPSYKDI